MVLPVSENTMNFKGNRNTPCQLVRNIYSKTEDQDIKLTCRVLTRMLKIMAKKISEHELGWEKIWDEISNNNS